MVYCKMNIRDYWLTLFLGLRQALYQLHNTHQVTGVSCSLTWLLLANSCVVLILINCSSLYGLSRHLINVLNFYTLR